MYCGGLFIYENFKLERKFQIMIQMTWSRFNRFRLNPKLSNIHIERFLNNKSVDEQNYIDYSWEFVHDFLVERIYQHNKLLFQWKSKVNETFRVVFLREFSSLNPFYYAGLLNEQHSTVKNMGFTFFEDVSQHLFNFLNGDERFLDMKQLFSRDIMDKYIEFSFYFNFNGFKFNCTILNHGVYVLKIVKNKYNINPQEKTTKIEDEQDVSLLFSLLECTKDFLEQQYVVRFDSEAGTFPLLS